MGTPRPARRALTSLSSPAHPPSPESNTPNVSACSLLCVSTSLIGISSRSVGPEVARSLAASASDVNASSKPETSRASSAYADGAFAGQTAPGRDHRRSKGSASRGAGTIGDTTGPAGGDDAPAFGEPACTSPRGQSGTCSELWPQKSNASAPANVFGGA